MNKEMFLDAISKLNIKINSHQMDQLDQFYRLLVSYNKKMNLTTITNYEDVYLKHFYDSLTLVKVIDLTQELTLLDVGTGAGFPGIVLKIVFPNLKITLLDSLNKRINYLNEVVKELKLENIETVCIRCEDYALNNREKYDVIVARAVSHLEILSELILPMVKVDGFFIAMKGDIKDEIEDSQLILQSLDSIIAKIEKFLLPNENSKRTLIKIQKLKKTNSKYPRKYDLIKKSHLKKQN